MKKNNIFCVSESLVTAAPKPNWPFSKSSLVKIWWRQVFQQFQLLRALISTDLALRGSVEHIAIEIWKKMDFNFVGMLAFEASSGVFAFFSIREAGQLLSNADATSNLNFWGEERGAKN